jgi:hypothetical protein
MDVHPLGLQVHLETRVAQGVLVVRSIPECAELLRRILTTKLIAWYGLTSESPGGKIAFRAQFRAAERPYLASAVLYPAMLA